MPERANSENLIKVLNVLIPALGILWAIVPVSVNPLLLLPSIAAFFVVLTFRSHELFIKRKYNGQFNGRFFDYLKQKHAIVQNIVLGVFLGSTGFIIMAISRTANAVGGFVLLGAIDIVLLALITYYFFRRPGIQRTLSRSFADRSESARFVGELASKYGMKSPELRIIASGRPNRANASSWSIPGGNSYIFANEDLFSVLNKEEVGGIFTHELGHIKARHSEKSFLISSLIPLLWINIMAAPFILLPRLPAFIISASVFIVAALYMYFWRGFLSRRFEKQADLFAARNYDREVYIASLRKLSEYRGLEIRGNNRSFTSHDAFDEREKLIRRA